MSGNEPNQTERLSVGEYTVHLRHLTLPMGLRVDEVKLSGKSIVVEREPFGVSAEVEGELRVHVGDGSLGAFLEAKAPAGLKRFHVTSAGGKLIILAVKKVLVDLKVKAVCSLEIHDRRALHVRLESVDVAGADVRNLIQAQLDALNPVIDVGMFPFRAAIDDAEVDRGGITLTGRIVP